MNCPHDNLLLHPSARAGLDILACQGCAGCWIDSTALYRMAVAQGGATLDVAQGAVQPVAVPCPRCGGDLLEGPHQHDASVLLQRCSTCQGLWCSQEHLERLLEVARAGSVRLVAGRYRVGERLLRGRFTELLRAIDQRTSLSVLLRRHAPELGLETPEARTQTLREGRYLSRLSHRNLPQVLEVLEEGQEVYLVLDDFRGITLEAYVREQPGPLAEPDLWRILEQLLALAGFLHAQEPRIVHRDLRPDTILITPHGTLKVYEFGLATMRDDPTSHTLFRNQGSPIYAAPEQLYGSSSNPRNDLYAIGAVMFFLATATPPPRAVDLYTGTSACPPLQALRPDLSRMLSEVVQTLMHPEAPMRPASVVAVTDLMQVLERELEGEAATGEAATPATAAHAQPLAGALAAPAGLASPLELEEPPAARAGAGGDGSLTLEASPSEVHPLSTRTSAAEEGLAALLRDARPTEAKAASSLDAVLTGQVWMQASAVPVHPLELEVPPVPLPEPPASAWGDGAPAVPPAGKEPLQPASTQPVPSETEAALGAGCPQVAGAELVPPPPLPDLSSTSRTLDELLQARPRAAESHAPATSVDPGASSVAEPAAVAPAHDSSSLASSAELASPRDPSSAVDVMSEPVLLDPKPLPALDPTEEPSGAASAMLDSVQAAPATPVEGLEARSERRSLWSRLFGGRASAAVSLTPTSLPGPEEIERYPFVDLSTLELEREAGLLLPETVARSIQGVCIGRASSTELTVAVKDPTQVHIYDHVAYGTKGELRPRLMRGDELLIDLAHQYIYRLPQSAQGLSWLEWLERKKLEAETLDVKNVAEVTFGAEDITSPIIAAVDRIIKEAISSNASDIHLETFETEMVVRYRIDGVLNEISTFGSRDASAILKRIKILANLDIAQDRVTQGGRISVAVAGRELDLRVSIVPVPNGESAVLRLLKKGAFNLTLRDLGFNETDDARFRKVLTQPYGMVLVSGPTGSGKSTTLYASLTEIQRPDRKLLTIEDPIEYQMPRITQVQVNTAPREDEKKVTFARALREFLRQDPDVILVGEIRDAETAAISVQAALTGHMLLSTIHTNDSVGIVARLRDMGIEPYLISSVLLGGVAQRLCRRICKDCRDEVPVPPAYRSLLEAEGLQAPHLYQGRGCMTCHGTGYRGRMGLYEILEVAGDVRELIAGMARDEALREAARAHGFRTLYQDGLVKATQGYVTLDEVQRVCMSI